MDGFGRMDGRPKTSSYLQRQSGVDMPYNTVIFSQEGSERVFSCFIDRLGGDESRSRIVVLTTQVTQVQGRRG